MTNKISVRQICFMLVAYGAAGKLLWYPAAMAAKCGNALLFPAAACALLQTAAVWAAAYLSSKTDMTLFELAERTFGRAFARVAFGLLALFFMLNCIVPLEEQQTFVHDSFYETIPSLYVFLPFFIFSVYAGSKGFTSAGRAADICFPVFILSVGALMVMSVGQCRLERLLPVLKVPAASVAEAGLGGLFRFTESAFLLVFLGHFKYKKGDCARLTLSYAAGSAIALGFMAIFYGVYGPLASSQTFAVSKTAAFFSGIELLGNLDLFTLFAYDIVLLFSLVLNVQASVYCLCLAFDLKNRALPSLFVNAALLLSVLLCNNKFSAVNAVFSRYMWLPAIIFAYAAPFAALALGRKR